MDARNRSVQRIRNKAAKADVELKFKKWQLSYGSKYSDTRTKSNIEYYELNPHLAVLDSGKSDRFQYAEKIFALYTSAQIAFSAQWNMQIGLRMEHSQTEGFSHNLNQTHRRSFTNLFPSAHLLFKVNEDNALSFSYGRRIDRPSYRSLNPFVRYITPYTTSEGNPFLQPYYTDNLELNYNYKGHWLSSLYISSFTNGLEQVEKLNSNNINAATTYENYYNQLTAGLTETFNFNLSTAFESNNSANIYYTRVRSFIPETIRHLKGWSASVQSDNTYALNQAKTYLLSASYWIQFPRYSAIYRGKVLSRLDFGLKAQYLQKTLTANIYVSDILRTQRYRNSTYYSNIYSTFNNYEDNRALRLSLSYSLGKSRSRAKSIRLSNEEEAGRAR